MRCVASRRDDDFIVGNSSAGVREAPHFGVPAINVGSRQTNRVRCESVLHVEAQPRSLRAAIDTVGSIPRVASALFGNGDSAARFLGVLQQDAFWGAGTQKHFVDIDSGARIHAAAV